MSISAGKSATLLRGLVPLALVAFLFLNGLGTLLGWQWPVAFDENRTLAGRPAWNGSLTAYLRAFDDYVKDNFPMRKPFLLGYNSTLYHGFRSATSSRVIIGRNGWIFGADYDSGDGRIGSPALSESYLRRLRISLEERRDWLRENGAVLQIMFYPTKTSIYGGKYLPPQVSLDAGYRSAGAQVAAYMRGHLDEHLVPIEGPLVAAAAQSDRYYYLTDTHATHQGAFVAIQSMIDLLQAKHPGIPFRPYPDFEIKPDLLYPTAYGRVMGIPFREMSYVNVPKGGYSTALVEMPAKLAESLPPGTQAVYLRNPAAGQSRSILIGDSFTNRMNFYMGEHFAEALTMNLNRSPSTPEGKFPTAVFREMKPHLVVMAYVESRLVDTGTEMVADTVPLANPAEVRESRLKRLFAAGGQSRPVGFKPFQSNGRTAFEVVPPAASSGAGRHVLLLRLTYSADGPLSLYRDDFAGIFEAEAAAIQLGGNNRTGYLFLPRAETGALGALRTDRGLVDLSHLTGEGVWLSENEL